MPLTVREPAVFVISNRLPVTLERTEDGKYETSSSSGGLVSALRGLSDSTNFFWYGWPGLEVPDEDQERVRKQLAKNKAIPVFLKKELAYKHYNGFSSTLNISFFFVLVNRHSPAISNPYLYRQDSLASFALPDARDSHEQPRLGGLPRSQSHLCSVSAIRTARW
jgi:hypothetical protein